MTYGQHSFTAIRRELYAFQPLYILRTPKAYAARISTHAINLALTFDARGDLSRYQKKKVSLRRINSCMSKEN
tara:strand:- start:437 stop:655 length:219 start_codon:yes stop_codon:yes gene_type:complete